jgi:hypothetical protein
MRKFAISIFALLAASAPACARQSIGSATLIEKIVEGVEPDRRQSLKLGDAVFLDERLETGEESRGKFLFDDRATLQMGPLSQVRLDSFVYANAPAVAFNATKGIFRFVSAPRGHKGYEVRTPNASISVRGTAFGVRSSPLRTDAVLDDGSIELCPHYGAGCPVLD